MLTPHDDDIPKPVPGEISLAGSETPDVSRFLNVRTALAPSLSPDGAAFEKQSRKAPKPDVELARGRFKALIQERIQR